MPRANGKPTVPEVFHSAMLQATLRASHWLTMNCSECTRLQTEYERLESEHTAAAAEFVRLKAAADQARIRCESVRQELERHALIHAVAPLTMRAQ